jgi:hypothetical protein
MIKLAFENKLSKKGEFFWLRIAAFSVLIGRAYQHFFFRPPYTELFWDEGIMKPILDLLGLDWSSFLESNFVTSFQLVSAIILLLACLVLFLPEKKIKRLRAIYLLSGIVLLFVALALFKGNFYRIGQLFEYSAQVGAVFLLYYWLGLKNSVHHKFNLIVRLLVVLTFLCHGLYAIGYYPVPYTFSMMVWETFPFMTESMIKYFLLSFGVLDIIAIVFIIYSGKERLYKFALLYCIVWGTITAFARLVGTFYFQMPFESLHGALYEVVYRLPHAILPLYLFLYDRKKEKVL